MKKRLIAFFLVLIMVLSVMPLSVFAVEEYYLWIGGTQVTSANMNDVLGDGKVSVTVRNSSYFVVLNNVNITGYKNVTIATTEYTAGIYCRQDYDMYIDVIGNCVVSTPYKSKAVTTAIYGGNITIYDSTNKSSSQPNILTLNTTGKAKVCYSIAAQKRLWLYSDAVGGYRHLGVFCEPSNASDYSIGAYAKEKLWCYNGSVLHAVGNTAGNYSYGIRVGTVSVNDSQDKSGQEFRCQAKAVVYGEAKDANYSYGFYNDVPTSNFNFYGGEIYAKGLTSGFGTNPNLTKYTTTGGIYCEVSNGKQGRDIWTNYSGNNYYGKENPNWF